MFYKFLLFIFFALFSCANICNKNETFAPVELCEINLKIPTIIDLNFSENENNLIIYSMDKWKEVSNNKINFIIMDYQSHDKIMAYEDPNYLYIGRLTNNDSFLISLDSLVGNNETKGYTLNNIIYIIPERIDTETYFILVSLHEEGHLLGMHHSMITNSVLYPRIAGMGECLQETPKPTFFDMQEIYKRWCN